MIALVLVDAATGDVGLTVDWSPHAETAITIVNAIADHTIDIGERSHAVFRSPMGSTHRA